MMRGFFDPLSMGLSSFIDDPIEGLPQEPIQSPIQDPAQEAFQFPFQYPNQDPSGGEGGQYAPVDVPENFLQSLSDPLQLSQWNDLVGNDTQDLLDQFSPGVTFVADSKDIGTGLAEQQGFDKGVFGEQNLNQGLMANVWNANQWADDNPDKSLEFSEMSSGDFLDQAARGFSENLSENDRFGMPQAQQSESAGSNLDIVDFSEILDAGFGDDFESAGMTAFLQQQIASMGKADLGGGESPIVMAQETTAMTGIDASSSEMASGAIPGAVGIDIAPVVGDLLDLGAGMIA